MAWPRDHQGESWGWLGEDYLGFEILTLQLYQINGIFNSINFNTGADAILPLKSVQSMLGFAPNEWSFISLYVNSLGSMVEARDDIVTRLKLPPEILAFTLMDLRPDLEKAIKIDKVSAAIYFSIFALLIALLLLAALLLKGSQK